MEIKLNEPQKRAVEAPRGPLLIVAGAGTGKTRTLISRILYLIERGIAPERICAITFTNKAAGEMMARIGAAVAAKPTEKKPYIGTFHSLGARILRRECKLLGREPNFAIFDNHDSFELIKKAVKEVVPKKFDEDGKVKKQPDKKESPVFFEKKIAEIKNLGSTVPSKYSSQQDEERIKRVFSLYETALAQNNAFDFDDLIEKPVTLFASRPATLIKYQSMYDAILVDEWQDINPKQYELVKLLASEHRNLSVVGDDEQTIYSWRYADVKMFLNFPKEWEGTQIEFLEENYRSTKTIIEAASAVVRNNQFRTPKKLWTANEAGEPISLFEAWGENDEAAWIAEKIETDRKDRKDREDREDREEKKNAKSETTTAILYRTNAQSRAIEQQLIRREIPYRIYGGLKFYERREVKDAVAALRYASNPSDTVSRERLEKNLTKRKFAEFRNALAELKQRAAQGDGTGARASADATAALKPTDILNLFFQSFGYFDYLETNFINADERMENIEELAKFVADFENLADVLEKLSLLQSTDDEAATEAAQNKQKRGNEIHLSTVHLAKGLEFDTVFIAGAAEGLLPHGRSLDDENQLEEERRLMYVAMTRARRKLHISFFGMASRFINEIPEQYVRLETQAEKEEGNENIASRMKYTVRNDVYRPSTDGEEYIELD